MFAPSAAVDGPQSQAIHKINEIWGDEFRGWKRHKNIGLPVCKKKYRPFEFQLKKKKNMGGVEIRVVRRMYGCPCHSPLRKAMIEKYGERTGWERFGQWSLQKAKTAARRETRRLDAELSNSSASVSSESPSEYTSSSEDDNTVLLSYCVRKIESKPLRQGLCDNGVCTWKIRGKYDDICEEIEEERNN